NVEKAVLMTGAGTMMITNVQISGVKMGVNARSGTVDINGKSTITFESGEKNYGVKVGREVTMASLMGATIKGG
uniref:hypothetical protein n=1 Tax=Bartonella bovis TaxID=155194 RepID=UPI0013049ED2